MIFKTNFIFVTFPCQNNRTLLVFFSFYVNKIFHKVPILQNNLVFVDIFDLEIQKVEFR